MRVHGPAGSGVFVLTIDPWSNPEPRAVDPRKYDSTNPVGSGITVAAMVVADAATAVGRGVAEAAVGLWRLLF